MDVLLGIDVGTTNTKACIYAPDGRVLALSSAPTPTVAEGPRRATQDPEVLIAAVYAAMRRAMEQLPSSARVAGLAVASVGEAGVPLDAHDRPLYPIIAWFDERSAPQAAWWATEVGETRIYHYTGLPLGHTFTLNKLLWLREHHPGVIAHLVRWLCISDYVAFCLTGQARMGYSLASRTMAFDLAQRHWCGELLAAAEFSADCLPEPVAEGTLLGHVTPAAARASGLPAGTPVYVGGHDHVCGALAMGAWEPGVVLDSTGTTEAELTTVEAVEPYLQAADLSFCLGCHVARGRYYAIGSILAAGSLLSWLAGLLWPGADPGSRQDALVALTAAAAQSPAGARGLYVLPHLDGAGSPDRCSTARGVLLGLGLAHTREDLARGVIEGLAYELRTLWEALERFTGHSIERVISIGGGARNSLWNQIKADVTGHTLQIPEHTEAVTLGAALLAGIGAGIYRDEREALDQVRLGSLAVAPDPEGLARYDELYRQRARLRPEAATLGRHSGELA